MTEENPDINLSDGWRATTYSLTGNFKLVAQFEHEETVAEVRVTPYKTYQQPGFCNAHRVVLVHPEEGVNEIAVGMEVEHVEDAEAVAVDEMEETSNSS